jgi:hypothetical protein
VGPGCAVVAARATPRDGTGVGSTCSAQGLVAEAGWAAREGMGGVQGWRQRKDPGRTRKRRWRTGSLGNASQHKRRTGPTV